MRESKKGEAMGGNRSLTVTLEAVTPLFLGGADPRSAWFEVPAYRVSRRSFG
jgi:hypothetical protein